MEKLDELKTGLITMMVRKIWLGGFGQLEYTNDDLSAFATRFNL